MGYGVVRRLIGAGEALGHGFRVLVLRVLLETVMNDMRLVSYHSGDEFKDNHAGARVVTS